MAYARYYLYKQYESTDFGVTFHETGAYLPSGDTIGIYDTLEECGGSLSRTIQREEF